MPATIIAGIVAGGGSRRLLPKKSNQNEASARGSLVLDQVVECARGVPRSFTQSRGFFAALLGAAATQTTASAPNSRLQSLLLMAQTSAEKAKQARAYSPIYVRIGTDVHTVSARSGSRARVRAARLLDEVESKGAPECGVRNYSSPGSPSLPQLTIPLC
jgi:hypothetical protein